jgi:hypothetical protein
MQVFEAGDNVTVVCTARPRRENIYQHMEVIAPVRHTGSPRGPRIYVVRVV